MTVLPRRYFHARLADAFDRLIDVKFKESVEIWPDDKPIPMGDGTFIMPTDIEIISVPSIHGINWDDDA